MADAGLVGLEGWLEAGYAPAYRTAWLILRDRADAEEAVQEAFLRAWRFRTAIPDSDTLGPWLYRVVVNACLSKLRAERRHRERRAPLDVQLADDPRLDPDVLAVAGDARRLVSGALARLPEHLRVVVALRYYAGLSESEIAGVIRRRPGTVKSRLHEARSRLSSDPDLVALVHGRDELEAPR